MKLYVGGLSFETTDAGLRAFFERAGTVDSATVIVDRESGGSRGFGFVEMGTGAEAERAIAELSGKDLDGRAVNIDKAKPRTGGVR